MKKEEKKSQILWQLFKATFLLSAFTFGGGFVIVSLMKKKFVEELGWLDESEMLDITAIAQSSPGPIPINASVILGYRMCGIPGSLVAILGTALPPMIIISTISYFYAQFRSNQIIATALQVMRAGVAAVIFDVVWNHGCQCHPHPSHSVHPADGRRLCSKGLFRCAGNGPHPRMSGRRSA